MAAAITVESTMAIPSEMLWNRGIHSIMQLSAAAMPAVMRKGFSFRAWGTTMATNMPYRATPRAVRTERGSTLLAAAPQKVPLTQPRMGREARPSM